MEQRATTLVYFKESNRLRNESGITISLEGQQSPKPIVVGHPYMNAVIQN
jgi:hypothetical protein